MNMGSSHVMWGCVKSHIDESCPTCMSRVTYRCVKWLISRDDRRRRMSQMDESGHTWLSHVPHVWVVWIRHVARVMRWQKTKNAPKKWPVLPQLRNTSLFFPKKKTHQKVLFVDIWTYTKTTTEIRHNNVTSITIITEYASLFPEKKPHVLHEWVMSHVNITSITVLPHLQNTRLYTENTRV